MDIRDERLSIPAGEETVTAAYARPCSPTATVVVAHGAGAGMDHPFLTGFTGALNDAGVATWRFNFPYAEAGKKFPDRAPKAVATWRAVMAAARERAGGAPVWAASKSFGGRMASMAVAEGMETAGLVFLGYPLHPPGRPEKLRDEHLYGLTLPMLFLQGSRDAFALPGELEPVAGRIGDHAVVRRVANADHSFTVPRDRRNQEQTGAGLAPAVLEFIAGGA
ncbi:alpha/beta family hydrolase [Citricoccus sp.]|uniref:alpha/beta hydrolase family protein n=1 Tax=Citricoccus sp. TaxID=1978372 RepID=UPI002630BB07|nr:alpha/beta family hydrolase [Citricoccus sp.]HRO30063.1 dienelactone hydrolase [Citricoccus sp.]HRO94552.1 dienelactone hydrolase [Citricoccus sp.]